MLRFNKSSTAIRSMSRLVIQNSKINFRRGIAMRNLPIALNISNRRMSTESGSSDNDGHKTNSSTLLKDQSISLALTAGVVTVAILLGGRKNSK